MKKLFKVLFVIGISIIVITLLLAVVFRDLVNISFWSLWPFTVFLMFMMGVKSGLMGEKHPRDRYKYGFKYSKVDGKGSFYREREYKRTNKNPTFASIMLLFASLLMPFVFFFSDNVKKIVGGVSIALIAVFGLGLLLFAFIAASIQAKKDKQKENEEAEAFLKDQEKREQMGRWK